MVNNAVKSKSGGKMKQNIIMITIFTFLIGCDEIECTDIGENLCIIDNGYNVNPADYLDRLKYMFECSGIERLKEEIIVITETDESILWEEEKRRINGSAGIKHGAYLIRHQNGEEEAKTEIFYILLTTKPYTFSHEIGHILEHQEGIISLTSENSPKDHRPTGLARCGDKIDRLFNKEDFEKLEELDLHPNWRNLEGYE